MEIFLIVLLNLGALWMIFNRVKINELCGKWFLKVAGIVYLFTFFALFWSLMLHTAPSYIPPVDKTVENSKAVNAVESTIVPIVPETIQEKAQKALDKTQKENQDRKVKFEQLPNVND